MSLREQHLREYLESLDVPLGLWGTGKAKTIQHLGKELRKRECTINGIVREIHTVIVDLCYEGFHLIEICQVFEDGRIRKRNCLPGEKLRIGERPVLGFRRCLREELGMYIGRGYRGVHQTNADIKLEISDSYPGLLTRNVRVWFRYEIPKELYNPDGYVEWQKDKSTYFDWIPCTS